jgi:hypothetical protein
MLDRNRSRMLIVSTSRSLILYFFSSMFMFLPFRAYLIMLKCSYS